MKHRAEGGASWLFPPSARRPRCGRSRPLPGAFPQPGCRCLTASHRELKSCRNSSDKRFADIGIWKSPAVCDGSIYVLTWLGCGAQTLSDIILGISMRVYRWCLHSNRLTSGKEVCSLHCGWASSSQLKASPEQEGLPSRQPSASSAASASIDAKVCPGLK